MKEYKFKVNEKDYTVAIDSIEENIVNVVVNNTPYKVELENAMEAPVAAARPEVQRPAETAPAAAPAAISGEGKPLKSPLPGVILDFYVNVGDTVKNGQKVLLLEAMKMENNIDSDRDGTVLEIKVAKGDSVNEGDTLMVIG
jgi:biotin carboxyl carrier protein